MTRAELVTAVAEQAGLTKLAADKTIKGILDEVTACLRNGDKLTLVGFGTFNTTKRQARSGLNPQTGKKITIPATVSPRFKAGNALREAINGKKK